MPIFCCFRWTLFLDGKWELVLGGGHLKSTGSPKDVLMQGSLLVSGWPCTSCAPLLVVWQSGKEEAHWLLLLQCFPLQVFGLDLWQLSYCNRASGNRPAKETVPTHPGDPKCHQSLGNHLHFAGRRKKVTKFLLPSLSYHHANEKCIHWWKWFKQVFQTL